MLLDLVGEEVEQVAGDFAGVVVQRLERGVPVLGVGLDDRDDLLRVDPEVPLADPVTGVGQRHRQPVRRQRGAVVDVVHALEVAALPRVHLEDDLLGLLLAVELHFLVSAVKLGLEGTLVRQHPLQIGLDRPVFLGLKGPDLLLPLHHQTGGHRLDPAGGQAAADFPP
ncbi:hypothetical protein SDC9_198408 [bioreactor metagenome]|uniref:Uncharacterized protein n=1 Tax=bioreactor metagenome TaxID=1076179 RepID=A0A645IHL5_9ZZZZ